MHLMGASNTTGETDRILNGRGWCMAHGSKVAWLSHVPGAFEGRRRDVVWVVVVLEEEGMLHGAV